MPKVNRNEIAVALTAAEGLKHQINVADMKEIMKVYNNMPLEAVIALWFAYNK